ncbi:hypothetical protein CCR94_11350 [Rhodoblastus sphagnicola]|uniref:Outer membrane protein beta-barrel domain-containing protein n=1 Tax=Rhodoblastus sphagnicola TaxID=333368 RepID=A0A2S6N875_9HYPH|nr:outer membrane beta-barrel protein [Rhodoblastus sphagnicola]MBB4201053.1 outer membrane immunogenic protein [Rhodoblastus sphagnicola]PPQ30801.1 hypothetical protein CCR94_11350 [Rhodoblastus sphagnicola]
MKSIALCSVFGLIATTSSFAQPGAIYNIPPYGDAPPVQQGYNRQMTATVGSPRDFAPSSFSWSGIYVGGNVGLSGGDFRYPAVVSSTGGAILGEGAARLNSSGVLGGGQVGVNFQLRGPIVVGLEADIQGASVTGEVGVDSSLGGTTLSGKAGSRIDFLGTARARVGAVILDRGLLYATGGFAYAGGNSYVNGAYGGSSVSISKETLARGFAVGGGLEYALTDHWSLRSEYLYADLGKTSLYNGSFFSANANLAVETTTHIVRAGVNYRFGGPEPIIAKF